MNMLSLDQIKTNLVSNVLAMRSDVRLVAGDPNYDLIVESTAPLFYRYEILLEYEDRTRNLTEFQALIADTAFQATLQGAMGNKQDGTPYTAADVATMISDRLDAYVRDFNVTRSGGTQATGLVAVYLTDATPVSWNSNTTFTSAGGFQYTGTSAISNVVPHYSNAKGLYYVTIPIQAASAGSAGNATAGALRAMTPKFASFSYCTNETAITGGSDAEQDLELIGRAQQAWVGRTNGSLPGVTTLMLNQAYVDNVLALDQDDATAGIFIGSVCDLFTQFTAQDTELVEEYFYWAGEELDAAPQSFSYVPQKQPLVPEITPVVYCYDASTSAESQVIPDGGDTTVTIVKDSGTYSGSVKAQDTLVIKQPLEVTSAQTAGKFQRKLRVLYVYDKNPYKLQAVVDDVNNRMIGPSPLVRQAVTVPLRVICEPTIAYGYVPETVQATITSNLLAFFNGGTTSYGKQYARKTLGEQINHTDIGQVILRTAGVLSYDTDTFKVINTLTADISDPTVIGDNQYATLYDVLFQFNTFNISNFSASYSNP